MFCFLICACIQGTITVAAKAMAVVSFPVWMFLFVFLGSFLFGGFITLFMVTIYVSMYTMMLVLLIPIWIVVSSAHLVFGAFTYIYV